MVRVDLSTKAVMEQAKVKRQLGKDFDGFKDAIGKDGCKVLFLNKGRNFPTSVSLWGKKEFLRLDPSIMEKAERIVVEENIKLAKEGISGGWKNGEKTAVQRVDAVTKDSYVMAIRVRKMLFSHILAMNDEPFEKTNNAGMRKLDTNTHVITTEKIGGKEFKVILIADRGKKVNDKRMGEKPLCSDGKRQLTLSTNGMVDADMLVHPACEIIGRNSLREFGEEANVSGINHESVVFEGMIVDTQLFTGAYGIVTSVEVPLTLKEINKLKENAPDSGEIREFEPIEHSTSSIAKFLKDKRKKCVPQLISGLVVYGYNRYGTDFLKEVTRL